MVAVRAWFLAVVAANAASIACAGKSTVERVDTEQDAGATSTGGTGGSGLSGGGATGGSAPMSSGGSSGTGGTAAGAPGSTGGVAGAPQAACDDVTPCGGDVAGEWSVASSCLTVSGELDLRGFGLGCETAPITGVLQVTGSWGARAGQTISDDTVTFGTEEFTVPDACLEVSGTLVRCEQLGPAFASMGYADVRCADSEIGCICAAIVEQTGGMGTVSVLPITQATYTTAGNVLAISDDFNETAYSYCNRGSTMSLSLKTVGPAGTVTGTILLRK